MSLIVTMRPMVLVYRYRVKSRDGLLSQQAQACNIVWNYCNDTLPAYDSRPLSLAL